MIRIIGAAFACLVVLSACGGGGTSGAPAAAGDVTAQGLKFAPQSLEVKVGTRVTWTNKDTTTHTVTSGTPGSKDNKFDGQLAAGSGTFFFTFAQAGTFAYFCQNHPTTMTGTIVVK